MSTGSDSKSSLSSKPKLGWYVNTMAKIKFRRERCKGCGLCVMACPKKILEISPKVNRMGYPVARVNGMEACTGCALCAEMCPDLVITVFK